MTGCAAPNCSNHSRNGFKFFRFPADCTLRKKWVINCRRQNWNPTQNDRLCSEHFEANQIEQHRQDGKSRLKPFAVPTIFNVTNPPKLIDMPRKSVYKRKRENDNGTENPSKFQAISSDENVLPEKLVVHTSVVRQQNVHYEERIKELEEELEIMKNALRNFLTSEQIEKLKMEQKFIKKWSNESVLKAFKLRFALGKNGYNFLRSTGYPAPAYSTLNKRISSITINFGLINSILNILPRKIDLMNEFEKDCSIMVDEMEISGQLDFDKSRKIFVGRVTLGNTSKVGNHLTLVALRGINSPWKQIVACHITGPNTGGCDMKQLIFNVIEAATAVGLKIRNLTSDMGSNNKALWAAVGVTVNRTERKCGFKMSSTSEHIHVLADPPHLLKNWKSAIQKSDIILSAETMEKENLPTQIVSGKYINSLWEYEIKSSNKGLRSLHHLNDDIINSSHFSKMNVGNAMKYISIKTAAALEAAVINKILPPEALTTAWFLRLLRQWFEIINSRRRITSITARNFQVKEEFMYLFVDVVQDTVIGKGWKPLNTGSILTSLSFLEISRDCFKRGYKFVLGSRLTQDGLENIFSQIRRKAGLKPSALECLRAIKLICVSQFMSDIKNTNYCSDSDQHLLDYHQTSTASSSELNMNDILPHSNGELANNDTTASLNDTEINTLECAFSPNDCSNIYYIAGSCINYVLVKKKICEICTAYLQNIDTENLPESVLTECADLGGLKYVPQHLFKFFRKAECIIQKEIGKLLRGDLSFNDIFSIFKKNYKETFPSCCNVMECLLNHYIIIRGLGLKEFEKIKNCKCNSVQYSTKSGQKK